MFRKKPVQITAFISEEYEGAAKCFPIARASRHIPKWWKDIPSAASLDISHRSMRSCPGIVNTFKTGFVLTLWSDLLIESNQNAWRYQFSDGQSVIVEHSNVNANGFYNDHWIFKLESPWILQSSRDMKIAFCDFFYGSNAARPYQIPYGINETLDKKMHTNVFLFLQKQVGSLMLRASTPMFHLLPLTEDAVTVTTEIISQKQMMKLKKFNNNFGKLSFKTRFFRAQQFLRRAQETGHHD